MFGQTNCPAHFSTANETFLGAVLCTSYFLFGHFRVHWMGEVSLFGSNVIQHGNLIVIIYLLVSKRSSMVTYPNFLWPFPFTFTED